MRFARARTGGAAAFARADRPKASAWWRQESWCAVDLELTGLDRRRDHIIAIGAVPIEDGRAVLGQSIYTLVRTARRSEHAAVLAHRLRVADLAEAPVLDDAIELVLRALAGRVPVFHTAAVDRCFLAPALRRRRVRLPPCADTEALGRLWLRERDEVAPARLPLARLATLLGQRAYPAHHALGDALTTAQAFVTLAGLLDANESQTVGSLVGAADRLRGARRMA